MKTLLGAHYLQCTARKNSKQREKQRLVGVKMKLVNCSQDLATEMSFWQWYLNYGPFDPESGQLWLGRVSEITLKKLETQVVINVKVKEKKRTRKRRFQLGPRLTLRTSSFFKG